MNTIIVTASGTAIAPSTTSKIVYRACHILARRLNADQKPTQGDLRFAENMLELAQAALDQADREERQAAAVARCLFNDQPGA